MAAIAEPRKPLPRKWATGDSATHSKPLRPSSSGLGPPSPSWTPVERRSRRAEARSAETVRTLEAVIKRLGNRTSSDSSSEERSVPGPYEGVVLTVIGVSCIALGTFGLVACVTSDSGHLCDALMLLGLGLFAIVPKLSECFF